MWKKIKIAALMSVLAFALTGCCMEHTWAEATCTTPKTCSECGKQEGVPREHIWQDATCTEPQICELCNAENGEPNGHEFAKATCTIPATCKECGVTDGEVLPHEYSEATCTEPQSCKNCGATEGEALGHELAEATCTDKAKCTRCGQKEGEALGHDYVKNVCTRCSDKLIETYDELRNYLKKNYGTIHTALGDIKNVTYEINVNDPNFMHPYDFEIQIMANDLYVNDMKAKVPYMVMYGDALPYENRIQAVVDLLNFEMEIAKLAEDAFPGLKCRLYYFYYAYEWPTIKEGYWQNVYLPFYNYRPNNSGKNGYVSTDLCDWYMTEKWFFEGATVEPFIYCYKTYNGQYACGSIHKDVMNLTDLNVKFEGHY